MNIQIFWNVEEIRKKKPLEKKRNGWCTAFPMISFRKTLFVNESDDRIMSVSGFS